MEKQTISQLHVAWVTCTSQSNLLWPGEGRCPCRRCPWAGAALEMCGHSTSLHFCNGAERWEAERLWRLFRGITALFSSTEKIWQDGEAKIPALHQGKKKKQTHSRSAAALEILYLGSVGKTHIKAECP